MLKIPTKQPPIHLYYSNFVYKIVGIHSIFRTERMYDTVDRSHSLYLHIEAKQHCDLVQIARSKLRANLRWFNLCFHFSHNGARTLTKIWEGNSISLVWTSSMLGLFSRRFTSCVRDVVQQTMSTKFRTAPAHLALGACPNSSVACSSRGCCLCAELTFSVSRKAAKSCW